VDTAAMATRPFQSCVISTTTPSSRVMMPKARLAGKCRSELSKTKRTPVLMLTAREAHNDRGERTRLRRGGLLVKAVRSVGTARPPPRLIRRSSEPDQQQDEIRGRRSPTRARTGTTRGGNRWSSPHVSCPILNTSPSIEATQSISPVPSCTNICSTRTTPRFPTCLTSTYSASVKKLGARLIATRA